MGGGDLFGTDGGWHIRLTLQGPGAAETKPGTQGTWSKARLTWAGVIFWAGSVAAAIHAARASRQRLRGRPALALARTVRGGWFEHRRAQAHRAQPGAEVLRRIAPESTGGG